jgi:hypothetical protein
VRAYWTGALLREANTRDVWLFVTPAALREEWPRLIIRGGPEGHDRDIGGRVRAIRGPGMGKIGAWTAAIQACLLLSQTRAMNVARTCLLAAVLGAACEPAAPVPHGATPATDSATTRGAADAPPVGDAGVGHAEAIPAFSDGGAFVCPEKVLCPSFEVTTRVGDPPRFDLEAARCVFRALRDRTPGLLAYTTNNLNDRDVVRHRLHVLSDGTIYEEKDRQYDSREYHYTQRLMPPSPDFFARCLTETDVHRAEGCLFFWKDAYPVTAPIVCGGAAPPGGYPRPDDPRCPNLCVEDPEGRSWHCWDLPSPCKDRAGDAAITCALEAFRDGKEGWYSWNMATTSGFPYGFVSLAIIVRPGRLGLTTSEMGADLSVQRRPDAGLLRDPAYFTDCLAKTDPEVRLECFKNAITGRCK